MQLSRISSKIKLLYKKGGGLYLLKYTFGYPIRCVKYRNAKTRSKFLMENTKNQEVPGDVHINQSINPDIVVSLTSYPARFKYLPLCLKSLLLQTFLPDRIIVYLGNDTKDTDITEEMNDMRKYGVEFRVDKCKNLKPHKKYFYAMQEFPKAVIITVDDDVVYPPTMIEELLQMNSRYPNSVCARRTNKIMFDRNGDIRPYEVWEKGKKYKPIPSKGLIAVGISGVLYPPACLPKQAFDVELIELLCLDADDIWLKCMEILSGVSVVYVKSTLANADIIESQKTALSYENTGEIGKNDIYLKKVMDHFGIIPSDFVDK